MRKDFPLYEMDLDLIGGISKPMSPWGVKNCKPKGRRIKGFNYFINNKNAVMPEKALLAAIVYRALVDLQSQSLFERSDYKPRRFKVEAVKFFLSDEPVSPEPKCYTFIEICTYLNLDPQAIRDCLRSKGLLDWK